ncbi:hypothetical protein [Burkholderia sp. BCC1644]|nr:hypothetical protein [Burkholderia sp. BCC1644]
MSCVSIERVRCVSMPFEPVREHGFIRYAVQHDASIVAQDGRNNRTSSHA